MTRTKKLTLGFAMTVTIGAFLWPALGAQKAKRGFRVGSLVRHASRSPKQAMPGCKLFVGVAHAVLPTSTPMADSDSWGGPLSGMLDGEYLGNNTVLSGNDGEESWYEEGYVGVGKGGSYTICTDFPTCSNTFTYEVPFAVFPGTPSSLMSYLSYDIKILSGTGRFAGASGVLDVHGPAVVWPDDASPLQWSGRWNAEISGNVCGIQ